MAGPKPTPPQSAEEPSPKRIKLQEADG
uniref:Uncharacterized protein n=1 Tax=Anguilla anguilla TaxID=7936 RepID=A0A0E9WDP0_ANGAN